MKIALTIALGFAVIAIPIRAGAHAVVYPATSAPNAFEKYVLRVPNERDVATTRIEIRFPRSARVISFGDVPGWLLEVVTDSAKHVTGAVWTGSLAPQHFVELPFIAVNPANSVKLVWPVFQTYSSGGRVDWTGHDDAKQPAATTLVAPPPRGGLGVTLALWVCLGALLLAVAGLVLALRPEHQKSGFHPGA